MKRFFSNIVVKFILGYLLFILLAGLIYAGIEPDLSVRQENKAIQPILTALYIAMFTVWRFGFKQSIELLKNAYKTIREVGPLGAIKALASSVSSPLRIALTFLVKYKAVALGIAIIIVPLIMLAESGVTSEQMEAYRIPAVIIGTIVYFVVMALLKNKKRQEGASDEELDQIGLNKDEIKTILWILGVATVVAAVTAVIVYRAEILAILPILIIPGAGLLMLGAALSPDKDGRFRTGYKDNNSPSEIEDWCFKYGALMCLVGFGAYILG